MVTAVITGASSGLGKEYINAIIAEYPTVDVFWLVARRKELLKEIADEHPDKTIAAISLDLSQQESLEIFEKLLKENEPEIKVLVNNAGVAPAQRLDILSTTEENFSRVLDVNLKGGFFMCQAGARAMIGLLDKGIEGYSPRIVNISSISAYTASVNRGEYCISKAGVSMTTQLFAARLAEYGIPVFEVRPGIIDTDMIGSVRERYQNLIQEGLLPTQRLGTPQDVAGCVLAACSGLLDYGTGQVLNADGGFHLRRL